VALSVFDGSGKELATADIISPSDQPGRIVGPLESSLLSILGQDYTQESVVDRKKEADRFADEAKILHLCGRHWAALQTIEAACALDPDTMNERAVYRITYRMTIALDLTRADERAGKIVTKEETDALLQAASLFTEAFRIRRQFVDEYCRSLPPEKTYHTWLRTQSLAHPSASGPWSYCISAFGRKHGDGNTHLSLF